VPSPKFGISIPLDNFDVALYIVFLSFTYSSGIEDY